MPDPSKPSGLALIVEHLTADPFGTRPAAWDTVLALVKTSVARLGWGTMTYRCDSCGFEWKVWLSMGVEGPPGLRSAGLYVASPFTTRCPAWPNLTACEGTMSHVQFAGDEEFTPLLIPDDAPRFVLPYSMTRGDHGAHLEIPEPALIRARRLETNQGASR